MIGLISGLTLWLCQDVLRPYLSAVLYACICATLLNDAFFETYKEIRLILIRAVPPSQRRAVLSRIFYGKVPQEHADTPWTSFFSSCCSLLYR